MWVVHMLPVFLGCFRLQDFRMLKDCLCPQASCYSILRVVFGVVKAVHSPADHDSLRNLRWSQSSWAFNVRVHNFFQTWVQVHCRMNVCSSLEKETRVPSKTVPMFIWTMDAIKQRRDMTVNHSCVDTFPLSFFSKRYHHYVIIIVIITNIIMIKPVTSL